MKNYTNASFHAYVDSSRTHDNVWEKRRREERKTNKQNMWASHKLARMLAEGIRWLRNADDKKWWWGEGTEGELE